MKKQAAKTPVLVREPLTVPKANDPIAAIARKAETLFGYKALKTHMHIAEELGKVLVKLDIQPFSRETVETYKKSKTKTTYTRDGWQRVAHHTSWARMPINQYTKPIPEFVLNKAIQLKEALPAVNLFVEETRTSHQPLRRPDPFLVAVYKEEEFWIEVWNEPKFEGKLR